MTGAVINPAPATGTVDMPTGQTPSPSYVNSFRISAVIERLLVHLRGGSRNDNTEFFNLCLSLARGIDYAVANNEIPGRALDLPYLLKQVCQRKNDTLLHAAIMVLMISVKSACRNGWFSEKENEELYVLSNEIGSSFCSVKDMNCEESTFHQTISTIMLRFYPRMKMGEIVAFVEAMPGYGAFVKDFQISKNAKSSPDDKIYLFVAQTDNIETSSCIISPQQVNFLLNGKAVDRRTCVYKDAGPQMPTQVTHMLKYGTNLLQAVGQFNGKYIIVVAFMSQITNPSCPTLPNYVPPAAAAPDSDGEIIEGPSRVSLNCPISFTRIKNPVKGHLCKHLQCFDFDNYIGINSRRPSWRCPHCSQSVSFDDLRIDQSMVKVLKEVGANISYVKISADGSWEAVTESDDHPEKPHDKTPLHQESTTLENTGVDILDLTEGENEMDTSDPHQDNDSKPSRVDFSGQPKVNNPLPSYTNVNSAHRNIAPHMEDAFWRDILLSTQATGTSTTRSDVTMLAPITDVPSTLNRETDTFQRSNFIFNSISQGQSQISASNNLQLQQYNNPNNISNEHMRYPTPATYITRTPIAVQALPAQTAGMGSGDRQQFSRSHLNPHQVTRMTSAPPSQHVGSQNWSHHDRSHISSQPARQFGAHSASSHQTNNYRYASALPADRFNSSQQQSPNQRTPNPMRPFAQSSPQVRQGGAQGGISPTSGVGSSQQAHYTMAAAQRAIQIRSWTPSIPTPVQTTGPSLPVTSTVEQRGQTPRVSETPTDASTEQNWRPTGRMRGSLSGRAYTDALSQFIIQPTQPVQASRPPVLNAPRPVIPPHLQALMANNINAQASQDGATAAGSASENTPAAAGAGSGGRVLPDQ